MNDDEKKKLNEKISGLFFIHNILNASEVLKQDDLITVDIIKKENQNYIDYFKNICKLLCIYNETNKYGIISKNSFENAKIEKNKKDLNLELKKLKKLKNFLKTI